MKYLAGIGIKFGMMFVGIGIVLGGFSGVAFSNVLAISLVLTVVSFLGDVFILPGINDRTAMIADFFLAWAGVWILGLFFIEQPMALGIPSFITALILPGAKFSFICICDANFLTVHRRMKKTSPRLRLNLIMSDNRALRQEICKPSMGKICTRNCRPKIQRTKSSSEKTETKPSLF
ncbi:DUF2512 family protein [Salicibibacter cibi]|uniref:DUF2512 family protein n=2 Tax=Salicibibacter cibi TaxID=2743001 RepID=A0A7T7CG27_9BACI|nr:DUF2512 family protein [Salicibibacter cibi]